MTRVEVKRCPSRYHHEIGKYKIGLSEKCFHCGLCAEICPSGVLERSEGSNFVQPLRPALCLGKKCRVEPYYCTTKCPVEAITIGEDPQWRTL